MNSQENRSETRHTYIDLIKTIAIIGVIAIHTCTNGYQNPILSPDWLSTVLLRCLSGASVPLFFMCSGVLLLSPEKPLPIKKLFGKTMLRILLSLFVWSAFYAVYHLLVAGNLNLETITQAIKDLILFRHEFHLYYLHILLIVYLFLPITRLFVQYAKKEELHYALLIWFLLGCVYPTVRTFWPFRLLSGIPTQWMINMTYSAIGYGLLGFYLHRYPMTLKNGFLLLLIGFVTVISATVYLSVKNGTLNTIFLEGMSAGIAVYAAGIFIVCYNMSKKLRNHAEKYVYFVSKASFCIYLVHVLWIYCFDFLQISVNQFACILSIPTVTLLNLVLSAGVYLVLQKIPLIRKWLI